MRRIALIGLPGSGKSLFGALLAELLGISFADTDRIIEKAAHLLIPEIFARYGEEYFREMEALALDRAMRKTEVVIATGGGLILREENRVKLQENCTVVYLKRSCEDILKNAKMEQRPLLAHNPEYLHTLYDERHQLYEDCARFTVENNAPRDTVIQRLKEVAKQCGF